MPVPSRGRAHRQDAELLGARRQDEAQQDRGQPDHHHDQQAARDQAVQQRRPVEEQEGTQRARARTRPPSPGRTRACGRPRPAASARSRAASRSAAGESPCQAPVEPLDRDAECRETPRSATARTRCPGAAISLWSSAPTCASCAGTSGTAASEARMWWRTAVTGMVMSRSARPPPPVPAGRFLARQPLADVGVVDQRQERPHLIGRDLAASRCLGRHGAAGEGDSSPTNIAMMDARTGIGLDPRAAAPRCAPPPAFSTSGTGEMHATARHAGRDGSLGALRQTVLDTAPAGRLVRPGSLC